MTELWRDKMRAEVPIAPLVVLRILFGGVMLFSVLRFAAFGWIAEQYIQPQFYFSYPGFEWVRSLGDPGMYWLFAFMGLSAFMIMVGGFYRFFAWGFFLSFTYVELIDKTNYLNHYYFISIMALLLALLPAHRDFSVDAWRKPSIRLQTIPRWVLAIPQLQLGMVYFFAGVAKLNYDWLVLAMPLKIWLPAQVHLPVIGELLIYELTAYLFSWGGALYDLTVPFLLIFAATRRWAYLAVLGFHLVTGWFFPIGMFPYIMIMLTLIFFPPVIHQQVLDKVKGWLRYPVDVLATQGFGKSKLASALLVFAVLHFAVQLLLPFRYLAYPGELFWTEQGYRFSWRVMLMEKAGTAFFYVKDKNTGRQVEEVPADYLTPNQEKMMSTQPDMILQFANYLGEKWKKQGIDPEVHVESYVTLNGLGSRPFIKPGINLLEIEPGIGYHAWLQPYSR